MVDTTLLLQTLLFGAALYFLTGALLRRFFLRRLPLPPGPSGWPIVGCLPLLGTMPHISLANLAKKYGPLMYLKLGTGHTIVVSSPDVARTFLKTLDHNVANRPLGAGPNYIAYDASDMVFAELGPRWKLLRKLASLHMLGGKAFNDWAPLRHQEVGCMVRDIYKLSMSQEKKVVPVLEIVSCALANIVGQKTLSQRVFTSHGEESTDFEEMITELMRLAGLFNIGDFIPSIEWMDLQGIQGRMKKLHAKFDGLITRMLEQHMATTADRKDNPDFFDIVMGVNAEEEGVVLNIKNYKALLVNLFISGSDTSACTVEWAMTELLKNPRMLKRLQEEMDAVVGKDRRLEESDLPNLAYLQAICNETFRRHPVVPLSIPRVSTVDFEAKGYHIPKDSRLLINTWAIGRDPTIWDDPLEFKPERFLEGKNARVNPGGTYFELIPFGAGRRICAGLRMGVVMVQLILGTLVHSFEWRVKDGGEVKLDEAFGLVLVKADRIQPLAAPRLAQPVYQ